MSELVNNLQSIYNIKLQIKDVLGTDSDLFEDYPDLIEEAIGEGGGSGSSADPWYGGTFTLDMIVNEESSADYVGSVISDNFNITLDENEESVEAVEWDENVTIDVEGTDVEKVVHVIVNGDPHGILGDATSIDESLNDYNDLYGDIFPILENVTLTTSSDPTHDGYDYLLEGDIYAWNLRDVYNPVLSITNNGFYGNGEALGFNVNVSGGGLAQGIFNVFNFLSWGGSNGAKKIMDNEAYETLIVWNLDPINYMDPITNENTHNSYFEITLFNDNEGEILDFENVTEPSVYSTASGSNFVGFKNLNKKSADTFDSLDIAQFVWASDIDPETGIDSGRFENGDTYQVTLSDSYTITATDEVVVNFHALNNNMVADLYINGIVVETDVIATQTNA